MQTIKSFLPILPTDPKILILGSMPSGKSLEMGEYYAHPQNQFWVVMGRILHFCPTIPYAKRVAALKKHAVALWDTLESCQRDGSLDANIQVASEKPNAISTLLVENRSIKAVFFNGRKSEQVFSRHILPLLSADMRHGLHRETLPSTSPAHAGMSKADKIARWEKALTPFL